MYPSERQEILLLYTQIFGHRIAALKLVSTFESIVAMI